jgi:CHAT domain-containing protein
LLAGIPPAAALRDAQVAVRSLTGAALQATLDRWRASDPALAEALQHLPAVPDEVRALHLYAEPRYWATFMLIGRGD